MIRDDDDFEFTDYDPVLDTAVVDLDPDDDSSHDGLCRDCFKAVDPADLFCSLCEKRRDEALEVEFERFREVD